MKIRIITLAIFFIFLAFFGFAQTPDANGILYVKKGSTGNGSAWNNAIGELADALKAAKSNTAIQQIWVAAGTYKPLYNHNLAPAGPYASQSLVFLLVKDVKLYGGFAGNENAVSQRNLSVVANQTILNGDINDNDVVNGEGQSLYISGNYYDNTEHVVVSAGDVGDAELNGFVIKRGNAVWESNRGTSTINGASVSYDTGGGMSIVDSSPTVRFCTFTENYGDSGGGLYVNGGEAKILSCTFIRNKASRGGGAYFEGKATVDLCTFSKNYANYGGGTHIGWISVSYPSGGQPIVNYKGPETISRSTFTENYAASAGGGIKSLGFTNFVSCAITNNKSQYAGAALTLEQNLASTSISITNCLIANNKSNNKIALYIVSGNNNTGKAHLLNCTLYGNDDTKVSGSIDIPISNCILWKNGDIIHEQPNRLSVKNSLIEGRSQTNDGNIDASQVSQEQLFINATGSDWSLRSRSIAVDAGNDEIYEQADGNASNNSLTTDNDLRGSIRRIGNHIDLGAFEYTVIPSNGIAYVKKGGSGNGSSWENAVSELADALKAAKTNTAIKEIWVAKGTYKPMYSAEDTKFGTNQGRDNSFFLVVGVKVYGGFAGTETTLAQRDLSITANSTTLSGDFNNDDIITGKGQSLSITNNSENAYHVVISADNSTGAFLDGFTITGGNANTNATFTVSGQTIYRTAGGGMAIHGASPSLNNLKIYGNSASISGGGVYLYDASPALNQVYVGKNVGGGIGTAFGAPSLTKVVLEGNNALYGGGINISSNASPILEDVSLLANYASGNGGGVQITGNATIVFNRVSFVQNETAGSGGAAFISYSSPKFVNVAFTGNRAQKGGALYALGNLSAPLFTNCTFKANQATGGQAIYAWETADIALNNCIVWKDTGFTGNNNLEENNSSFILKNTMLQYPGNGFDINLDMASTALLNKDPLFGNGADNIAGTNDDEFNLKPGSLAIGVGDNALYENADGNSTNNSLSQDKDLAGNPRLTGSNIDLGAFEAPATLPVTLLSFQIKKENNTAVLTWETASEKDNAGFEIFRATNDRNFISIARIAGKGTTNLKNSYTIYDRKPLNGINYYKLVQKDNDGKTEELGIKELNFSLDQDQVLLYPNPVTTHAKVQFAANTYQSISLTEISGKILQHLFVNKTETEKAIAMDNIPTGIYLLKLQGDGKEATVKIIKN